jgi:serpin B
MDIDDAHAFGTDACRLLAQGGGNLVFSPASIEVALRMALCGARGQSAAEIAAALHLSGPQAGADGLRRMSGELSGLPGHGVTFRAPNTMWVQAGLPLLPGFTAELREAAAVSLRDTDFASGHEAARQEINELIAKQTEGKITGLLAAGTLGALTRLVLVNAIYLKAAWTHPFSASATRDAPFYPVYPAGPQAGTAVTVPMMHLTRELSYLAGDGYQAVVLPYGRGTLAMTIVLPDGPLGSLPPGLAGGLASLPRRASRHRVALALPRFRQEGRFDLIPVLRQLGIDQAFRSDVADFSGITTAQRLHLSAVVHQAFIDVNEEGTEAAAATGAVASAMAARRPTTPVTMTVDHPFLFAITDPASELTLFLGQITSPQPG